MRVFAALLVAACATSAPDANPAQRVAGCWVSGDGFEHQLWSADVANPGRMIGQIVRPSSGIPPGGLSIESDGNGWRLCEPLMDEQTRCTPILDAPSAQDHASVLQVDGALRIAVSEGGAERLVFEGSRSNCDAPINVIPVP
jgi:hypothetical protein